MRTILIISIIIFSASHAEFRPSQNYTYQKNGVLSPSSGNSKATATGGDYLTQRITANTQNKLKNSVQISHFFSGKSLARNALKIMKTTPASLAAGLAIDFLLTKGITKNDNGDFIDQKKITLNDGENLDNYLIDFNQYFCKNADSDYFKDKDQWFVSFKPDPQQSNPKRIIVTCYVRYHKEPDRSRYFSVYYFASVLDQINSDLSNNIIIDNDLINMLSDMPEGTRNAILDDFAQGNYLLDSSEVISNVSGTIEDNFTTEDKYNHHPDGTSDHTKIDRYTTYNYNNVLQYNENIYPSSTTQNSQTFVNGELTESSSVNNNSNNNQGNGNNQENNNENDKELIYEPDLIDTDFPTIPPLYTRKYGTIEQTFDQNRIILPQELTTDINKYFPTISERSDYPIYRDNFFGHQIVIDLGSNFWEFFRAIFAISAIFYIRRIILGV